jgi:3D (Asp-Asp-Asp) domain-containing protein
MDDKRLCPVCARQGRLRYREAELVMARLSSLSKSQAWNLGFLLAMFILACFCLTAVAKQIAGPKLFATEQLPAQTSMTDNQPAERTSMAIAAAKLPLKLEEEDADDAPFVVEEAPLPPEIAKLKSADVRYYNGKKYAYKKTIRMRVTSYAPDPRCCWPYPGTTTASGLSVKTNGGNLVAADTSVIKMHSLVEVKGYAGGKAVPVLDRGGAIKGNRLDVLLPTFDQAKQWGSRMIEVKVYEPVK